MPDPRRRYGLPALVLVVALVLAGCVNESGVRRSDPGALPTSPPMLRGLTSLNGCDPATAQAPAIDAAAGAVASDAVTVAFGGGVGERYRPRCVALEVGGAVRFMGDFGLHPLSGGAVLDGAPVRDPLSPLPFTNAGTEAVFRADRPGVYPFYCEVHWVLGMAGVIYVR